MAAARLRKAFRYPEDSDGEFDREELDEEEQEQLLKKLQAQDNKRNAGYSMAFVAIPLLSAAAFTPSLISGSSSLFERFLCLLGMLSLVSTAYVMRHLPLQQPGGPSEVQQPTAATGDALFTPYVIPLNATVCALLALVYCLVWMTGASYYVHPVLHVFPGAMFLTTLVARRVMVSVDTAALERLKYGYKGA